MYLDMSIHVPLGPARRAKISFRLKSGRFTIAFLLESVSLKREISSSISLASLNSISQGKISSAFTAYDWRWVQIWRNSGEECGKMKLRKLLKKKLKKQIIKKKFTLDNSIFYRRLSHRHESGTPNPSHKNSFRWTYNQKMG